MLSPYSTLHRDAHARFSAEQVLEHPWLSTQADSGPGGTALATPDLLRRNNSTKDLTEFAENAVAVNRLFLQHMAFSEGPVFRVRGRSLARDGSGSDSDSEGGRGGGRSREEEAEEEERTSSFEEQRASSTLAHLDVSGFFVNELESGSSPRIDMSSLMIDVGGGGGGSGAGSSGASSKRASASAFINGAEDDDDHVVSSSGDIAITGSGGADDAASSFISTGSDEYFGDYLRAKEANEDDDDDDDEEEDDDDVDPGSSSGSSGSSGFGSFYGTSVETVINARLTHRDRASSGRYASGGGGANDDHCCDVVRASGVVAATDQPRQQQHHHHSVTAHHRDRGDFGSCDLDPSSSLSVS